MQLRPRRDTVVNDVIAEVTTLANNRFIAVTCCQLVSAYYADRGEAKLAHQPTRGKRLTLAPEENVNQGCRNKFLALNIFIFLSFPSWIRRLKTS